MKYDTDELRTYLNETTDQHVLYQTYSDLINPENLKRTTIINLYFENGEIIDKELIGHINKPKERILKILEKLGPFPVSTGKFKLSLSFTIPNYGNDTFTFADIVPITEMPSIKAVKEYLKENVIFDNSFYCSPVLVFNSFIKNNRSFKILVNREDEEGNMVCDYIVPSNGEYSKETYPIAKYREIVKITKENPFEKVVEWFTSNKEFNDLNISFDKEDIVIDGIYQNNYFYITITPDSYSNWKENKEKYFKDNYSLSEDNSPTPRKTKRFLSNLYQVK